MNKIAFYDGYTEGMEKVAALGSPLKEPYHPDDTPNSYLAESTVETTLKPIASQRLSDKDRDTIEFIRFHEGLQRDLAEGRIDQKMFGALTSACAEGFRQTYGDWVHHANPLYSDFYKGLNPDSPKTVPLTKQMHKEEHEMNKIAFGKGYVEGMEKMSYGMDYMPSQDEIGILERADVPVNEESLAKFREDILKRHPKATSLKLHYDRYDSSRGVELLKAKKLNKIVQALNAARAASVDPHIKEYDKEGYTDVPYYDVRFAPGSPNDTEWLEELRASDKEMLNYSPPKTMKKQAGLFRRAPNQDFQQLREQQQMDALNTMQAQGKTLQDYQAWMESMKGKLSLGSPALHQYAQTLQPAKQEPITWRNRDLSIGSYPETPDAPRVVGMDASGNMYLDPRIEESLGPDSPEDIALMEQMHKEEHEMNKIAFYDGYSEGIDKVSSALPLPADHPASIQNNRLARLLSGQLDVPLTGDRKMTMHTNPLTWTAAMISKQKKKAGLHREKVSEMGKQAGLPKEASEGLEKVALIGLNKAKDALRQAKMGAGFGSLKTDPRIAEAIKSRLYHHDVAKRVGAAGSRLSPELQNAIKTRGAYKQYAPGLRADILAQKTRDMKDKGNLGGYLEHAISQDKPTMNVVRRLPKEDARRILGTAIGGGSPEGSSLARFAEHASGRLVS
jgi:hypothetical protein